MTCPCHDTNEEHEEWFAEESKRYEWMADMAKRGATPPMGVPDDQERVDDERRVR